MDGRWNEINLKTHAGKEWALTLTTLGIFVTISVKAAMPLSSLVPAEAPASNKILAHSALLVSAASYEVNDTKDVKLVSEPKRYVTAKWMNDAPLRKLHERLER